MKGDYPARWVVFPYCIQRLDDGRYIVLNRRYKPLGVASDTHVVYEESPAACHMKITPDIARRLSWLGDDSIERIALYDGSENMLEHPDHLAAYVERLALLMTIRCNASHPPD